MGMKDDELTLIEDFRWWLGGLIPRWRGEEVTGVHAELAEAHAEIERLQNHVAELEAALVPFCEAADLMCFCPKCSKNTLTLHAKTGSAIICATNFKLVKQVLAEGGKCVDRELPV